MSVPSSRRAMTALFGALLLIPLSVPAIATPDTAVAVPDGLSVGAGATTTVEGLEITGFSAETTVLVTIAVESGDLGVTASGGSSVTDNGDLLRISGTPADVNATLATVSYTAGGTAGIVGAEVSVLITEGAPALNTANGHWYEFVSATLSWTDARAAALSRTLGGQPGYLVTVTSAEENEFVTAKLAADGWMGANDIDVEGTWVWADGPEAGTELVYTNWAGDEPNDSNGEDAAQFYSQQGGTWNDLDHETNLLDGYVVEYGGIDGRTVGADAGGSFSITVYDVPGAPTELTARPGDGSAQLSWTAPTGDEPVTGYRVDVSDDGATWTTALADTATTDTTTRIDGLSNGTEYRFRVAAVNDTGPGDYSDAVAVTPAQAPIPSVETPADCTFNSGSHTDSVGGWTVPCWTAPATGNIAADATADWQRDGVSFGLANGLVDPDPDGAIGVDTVVTRGLMASMLYRLAQEPGSTATNPFDDTEVHYATAVQWLAGLKITNGVDDTSFGGERAITRAEMVTLIWRMYGAPTPARTHEFADDIPAWAVDAVSWAQGLGIVTGRSQTAFDPGAPATIAESLTVLYRWISTLG